MKNREFYKMRPKQDEDAELIRRLDRYIESRKLSEIMRAAMYEWEELPSPDEVIEAIRQNRRNYTHRNTL